MGAVLEEERQAPWFSPFGRNDAIEAAGVRMHGGGPHQSKTLMLKELTTLLATESASNFSRLVLDENLLGKPSLRSRRAVLANLRRLYDLDRQTAIGRAFSVLWSRDPASRPLLALLIALARDPAFRESAEAVLDALPGTQVRAPDLAAAFEVRHPGRLGPKMAASLSRNAASSWTQAGFLQGAVRKVRTRAMPTPTVAAFAALIARYCGFGGPSLLDCRWLDVLDCPIEGRLSLLRHAEGLGLARIRSAGDVLEIDVQRSMGETLELQDLVRV